MTELSICFGTYNRLELLKQCIGATHSAAAGLDYEIVITDGGSTDGTLEYLRDMSGVRLIGHGELRGPVAAYNDAFRMARGVYVAYINDDLMLPAGSLTHAVRLLQGDPSLGIISIPYRNPGQVNAVSPTCTVGSKRMNFASFGVLPRKFGERVGWFGDFYHYYGDCYLSVRIQHLGYRFMILPGYVADHANADNSLRGENRWTVKDAKKRAREDGAKWAELWKDR